ncbi:hypothetical protein SELMODRAFT_427337 [Selaginella moellendorffii]|uniref:Uncharacterized protein n=1 Tax=Selaginella moellendorffii TaxID=88036 RepID=D8SZ93_SELML|nr:hypothetical protein SELMODRAFT_427337 [Selaginella moellendorffii]
MRNSICTPIFYKTALATVNEDQDGFQERNSSKPDHSNFLKSNSLSGSQQWMFTWCAHNASVCKDPAKFPSDLLVIESTVGAATMFAPSTVSESLGCLDMRAGRRRRLLQSIPGVWHHSLRSWKHERVLHGEILEAMHLLENFGFVYLLAVLYILVLLIVISTPLSTGLMVEESNTLAMLPPSHWKRFAIFSSYIHTT